MALNFRPVQETWGKASGCFIDNLISFIEVFAEQSDCGPTEQCPYGQHTSLWISDGSKFLDALEASTFPPTPSFSDNFEVKDTEAFASLCQNMKNLASAWRESLNNDGSLVFYIDGY